MTSSIRPPQNPLPGAVADLVRRMAGPGGGDAAELAARACGETLRAIERGDVCLPLGRIAGKTCGELRREAAAASPDGDGDGAGADAGGGEEESAAAEGAAAAGYRFPDAAAIAGALRAFPCIVVEGGEDGSRYTPFVLDGGRLYTRRNHRCERRIRDRLDALAAAPAPPAHVPGGDDPLLAGLSAGQRDALALVLSRRFAILTGGPGTGKTHVLARAVALAQRADPGLRVRLAAPTGKAAARMGESFAAAGGVLREAPSTLHRLVGLNPSTGAFRHHAGNPLPADWLVVDEASMVDLLLLGHVLDALPAGAGLLLIGDPHQLASVAPGRILRDLCEAKGVGGEPRYPIAKLSASYRFPAEGPIARFAAAVNAGAEEDAFAVLGEAAPGGGGAIAWTPHPAGAAKGPDAWPGFRAAVLDGFRALARARTPEEALAHANDCRVLCAVRRGPFGVARANAAVRAWLGPAAPMPVMATHNDPSLGVYNGDLGVVLPGDPDGAWLEPAARGGAPRRIPRLLLQDLEPAWATTVHKSQGSEYGDVAVVLPGDPDNPLLAREILYTAVTRTRRSVRLWSSPAALRACIRHPVLRATGFSG